MPAIAGVTMAPMSSFGGGDGWRSPGEIVAGDMADTATAGAYNYLTAVPSPGSPTERGLAFNPATGHLILVSRNGNSIRLLDSISGADIGALNQEGVVTGGIFSMNMAAAGTDGAVYVANLTTNGATGGSAPFKIYKWNSESASEPGVFFAAPIDGFNGGVRLGDSFDMIDGAAGPIMVAGCGSGVIGYAVISATGAQAISSFTPTGPAAGDFRLGISFGPNGENDVWGRQTGGANTAKRTTYSVTGGVYSGPAAISVAGEAAMDVIKVNGVPLLATLEMNTAGTGKPNVRVYDVTTPATPSLAVTATTATGTLTANGNGVGSIKWGAVSGHTVNLYALCTNQGIQAFTVTVTGDITPPSVATSPASRSVYERGQTTFTVSGSGTPPLTYQWFKGDEIIPNATSPSYTINPVTPNDAGDYKCRVSNAAPTTADSTPATLTVLPGVNTTALTKVWNLGPTSRPYLSASDNSERGLDYNPANNRLYLVSRLPSLKVVALSGTDGAELGLLNTTGVSGGETAFPLDMIGVAADNAIYASNLSNVSTGADFKIYQWPDDSPDTTPGKLYDGNPIGGRIGDSMAVRGAGEGTQIVCGARNTNQLVIFTKDVTGFFIPNVITTDAPTGAFALSVAFGEGNTVWGKNSGGQLVLCSFDFTLGTGTVIASYNAAAGVPGTVTAIGVDTENHCLAALQVDNSDNIRLYQYSTATPPVLNLLDQEFFLTDNPNANAVGSVSLTAGKAFAVDANNGIVAYSVTKPPTGAPPVITDVTQTAGNVSFKLRGTIGKTYQIEKSSELTPAASWTPDGTVMQNAAEETVTRPIPPGSPRLYFRAREQ